MYAGRGCSEVAGGIWGSVADEKENVHLNIIQYMSSHLGLCEGKAEGKEKSVLGRQHPQSGSKQ